MTTITAPQLKRLNTLYGQWAKHNLDSGENTREARLAELGTRVGRQLASTSVLTVIEAKRLIDGFQAESGIPETRPAQRRTQRDRDKAGTEGRRDQLHPESTLVSDSDIARIHCELTRLGWDQAHLIAWLGSASGPNQRRTVIRTKGDANRIWWALSHMQPRAKGATP